jgi:predicted DNA-binding transcriptional regulator AlpA
MFTWLHHVDIKNAPCLNEGQLLEKLRPAPLGCPHAGMRCATCTGQGMTRRQRLMGVKEIQQRLRLSRQRVQQLAERSDFPAPYEELAMGRIWLTRDIEAWISVYRPEQADITDLRR